MRAIELSFSFQTYRVQIGALPDVIVRPLIGRAIFNTQQKLKHASPCREALVFY